VNFDEIDVHLAIRVRDEGTFDSNVRAALIHLASCYLACGEDIREASVLGRFYVGDYAKSINSLDNDRQLSFNFDLLRSKTSNLRLQVPLNE